MEDSWFFPIFQATRNSLRQSPSQPTTVLQKIRNVTRINKQNLSPSELLNTPGFTFLYLFKMQSKGRENTAGNNKENCLMHGKLCCKKVILTASSIAPAFHVVLKIHPGRVNTCSQVTYCWRRGSFHPYTSGYWGLVLFEEILSALPAEMRVYIHKHEFLMCFIPVEVCSLEHASLPILFPQKYSTPSEFKWV